MINDNFYSRYWIKSYTSKYWHLLKNTNNRNIPKVMYTTSIIPLVRTLLGEIHKEVCHEKFWQASTAWSYFDLRCPSFIINVECMSVCPMSNIKFWCLWFRTKIDNSGKLSDKTGKFHPVIHLRCGECFESQQQSTKCLNALRS